MAFFDNAQQTIAQTASVAQEKLRQGWGEATRAVSDTAMEQLRFVRGFVRLCSEGAAQGWHERNGGNLSYRLTLENVESARRFFEKEPGEWVPLGVSVPELAGAFFLVTGAGKYLWRVADDPKSACGIVEIDGSGMAYRVVWGLTDGARPTSELPSHLLICAARMAAQIAAGMQGESAEGDLDGADRVAAPDGADRAAAPDGVTRMAATDGVDRAVALDGAARMAPTDSTCRVLYHGHPAPVLAMTALAPLETRAFTRALWATMPEGIVMFPEGVGVVPWMTPGGPEIAEATAQLMANHAAVVWANHGLFAAAPDFDAAFGLFSAVAKAADIYLRARAANGGSPDFPQTASADDLRHLAQAAGVADHLPEWMH